MQKHIYSAIFSLFYMCILLARNEHKTKDKLSSSHNINISDIIKNIEKIWAANEFQDLIYQFGGIMISSHINR